MSHVHKQKRLLGCSSPGALDPNIWELKRQVICPQHPKHFMMRCGEDNCKRYSSSKKRRWKAQSSHWSTTILKSRWADVVRFPYSRVIKFFSLVILFFPVSCSAPCEWSSNPWLPSALSSAFWAPSSTL